MSREFISSACDQLICSTTLEMEENDKKLEDWLLQLHCHLKTYVSPLEETLLDVDRTCLALLSTLTTTHTDSECEKLRLDAIDLISVENIQKQSLSGEIMSGCVLGSAHLGQLHSQLSEKTQDLKLLPRRPVLLVGRLTGTPVHVSPNEHVGALYFEDSTCSVVCEVPFSCKLTWLGSPVLLRHWTYIPKPDFGMNLLQMKNGKSSPFGYLEISDCVPLSVQVKVLGLPLVPFPDGIKTVSQLVRCSHSVDSVVESIDSVCGICSSVSPVCRNGSKPAFFLMELSDPEGLTLQLLVQPKGLLHLSQFLKLNQVYVINRLHRVRIKNRESDCLWSLSADSTITECIDYPTSILGPSDSEETTDESLSFSSNSSNSKSNKRKWTTACPYPKRRALTDEGSSEFTREDSSSHKQTEPQSSFVSYKGTIVGCVNSAAGIYELDSNLRLYTGYYSNVHYGRGLRVGAKVQLNSAHLVREEKTVLGFFCCRLSQITILQFSPFETPYEPLLDNLSIYFKHLPSMPPHHFVWYVETMERVKKNLNLQAKAIEGECRLYKSSGSCKVRKGLIDCLYLALTSKRSQPGLNACDEVFSNPHKCNVIAASPRLPTVCAVKDMVEMCRKLEPGTLLAKDDKVFLGIFSAGLSEGIQLRDSTGVIDVVTARRSNRRDESTSECQSSSLQPSQLSDVWMVRPFFGLRKTFTSPIPYAMIDMKESRRMLSKSPPSASPVCLKCGGKAEEPIQLRLVYKDAFIQVSEQFAAKFHVRTNLKSVSELMLQFSGESSRFHSLLHIDDLYRLSGICERCLSQHLSAKVFKPLIFNDFKMTLLDDLKPLDGSLPKAPLKSVVDVLRENPKNPTSLVSFTGLISAQLLKESIEEGRELEITIRNSTGPDEVTVYFKKERCPLPFGTANGFKVAVLGVSRRISKKTGRVYCVANPTTRVEILEFGEEVHRSVQAVPSIDDLSGTSKAKLCDFSYDSQGKPFIQHICLVQCSVTACQLACLKWICSKCKGIVSGGKCDKRCSSSLDFSAEARCIVDDGTAEALVFIYDSLVSSLLGLPSEQWKELQETARRSGQLIYRRYWHGGDYHQKAARKFDKYCTSPSIQRMVNLYCSQLPTKTPGYMERTVGHSGSSFQTLVGPRILLKCIQLADVDNRREAILFLKNIKQL